MPQKRLRGVSLALAAVALAVLLAGLLPSCPVRTVDAQLLSGLTGILGTLLNGVSSTLAATLGLVGGTVTTVTGGAAGQKGCRAAGYNYVTRGSAGRFYRETALTPGDCAGCLCI